MRCTDCNYPIKPMVTFTEEELPNDLSQVEEALATTVDLVIVLGALVDKINLRLSRSKFNGLPNLARETVPKVMMNPA